MAESALDRGQWTSVPWASHIYMTFRASHYTQNYIMKPGLKKLTQASLHLKAGSVLWYNPYLFLLKIMVYSFTLLYISTFVPILLWSPAPNKRPCPTSVMVTLLAVGKWSGLGTTDNIKMNLFYETCYDIYLYNPMISDLSFVANVIWLKSCMFHYFLHPIAYKCTTFYRCLVQAQSI